MPEPVDIAVLMREAQPFIEAFFSESGLEAMLFGEPVFKPDSIVSAKHLTETYLIDNDPNRKLEFQYYPGTWKRSRFKPFFSIKYSALIALSEQEKVALRASGLAPRMINGKERPSNARPSYSQDYSGIEIHSSHVDLDSASQWSRLARFYATADKMVLGYMVRSLMPT